MQASSLWNSRAATDGGSAVALNVGTVSRAAALARGDVSLPRRARTPGVETFADVGRPALPLRQVSTLRKKAEKEAVRKQANAQHVALKRAVEVRTRNTLDTMEPDAPAVAATMEVIQTAQASRSRVLDLSSCGTLHGDDLFVVLEAIRQAAPFVRKLVLTSLAVPRELGGPVATQLARFAAQQRLTHIELASDRCRLPPGALQKLQELCSQNAEAAAMRREISRHARASRRRNQHATPDADVAYHEEDSADQSPSRWSGHEMDDADGHDPQALADRAMAQLVIEENAERLELLNEYLHELRWIARFGADAAHVRPA